MARIEQKLKENWKKALNDCNGDWVLCGIDSQKNPLSERIDGFAGLIDWQLHGQVSRILRRGELPAEAFFLVGGDPARTIPSFLFFCYSEDSEAKSFLKQLRSLKISECHLAETTFPEDFLGKLKQALKKEGI